jgi:hypothetical protein
MFMDFFEKEFLELDNRCCMIVIFMQDNQSSKSFFNTKTYACMFN